jgi:peptidoglycan/xylan/chitin deacetylase (PgdA/CDA1 family)
MTNEPPARQRSEALASRLLLERNLGVRVRHFAYPDGAFNAEVMDIVEEAGYERAYTTCRHVDPVRPHLTVPRLLLWEQSSLDAFGRLSPNLLRCQSSGWWTGAPTCTWLAHA